MKTPFHLLIVTNGVIIKATTAMQINKQLAGLFEVRALDDLALCSLFLSTGSFTSQPYNIEKGYKWNSFILNYVLSSLGEFMLTS